jgi:SAM-dependent methyltransferase
VPHPAITLVDLNPNSLAAARRIARHRPRAVLAVALRPLPTLGHFDSIGLCYLLHRLPGTLKDKAAVLDHVRPLLAPGGRLFGATIVQGDAQRGYLAGKLMDLYNAKGLFSNGLDATEDLERALRARSTMPESQYRVR